MANKLKEQIIETDDQTPSDAERLEWVMRYGFGRTLGVAQDYDYIPLTLEIIDNAIACEKQKKV